MMSTTRLRFALLWTMLSPPPVSPTPHPSLTANCTRRFWSWCRASGSGEQSSVALALAELRRTWDRDTDDQLRRVAKEVFAPDRHAGAFVALEK
jgi:hypothetical protein